MDERRRMQALDDEQLDRVSGGLSFSSLFFGSPGSQPESGEIPLPVPTAAKECYRSPTGAHEYLPGSLVCKYCNFQKQIAASPVIGPGQKPGLP